MRSKIYFNLSIAFLFTFSAALIFGPALFGGKIINDFFGLDLAHYKFASDFGHSVMQGNFRLWRADYLGGFPVWLTQVGFFSPLVLIFYKFFKGFAVYNWIMFFDFLFGGLAMYWFARNLPLSSISSCLAGIAYMLSQNNIYWGPTLPFSNVYVFIPLFFLTILKISKGEKWWRFFGGLIAAYGLAACEIQIVFYSFVIGIFWAAFLDWNGERKFLGRALKGFILISFAGAVLASFWLLPVLNYLKLTTRGGALSFADLAYDFMRIADPLRFFYPYIQLPQFTGLASLGIVPNYYVGALVFILAAASIFLARKNKIVAFWLAVAAFSILVRVKWTGIFWLLHFLPGFNRFRGVFHWSFIGSFALTLLAGFALDNLEKIKESRYFDKFIGALKIFGWANVVFIAGIFSASLFRDKILKKVFQFFDAKIYSGKKLPLEHYHGVISSEFNKFLNAFSLGNYHFLVSISSVLAAILIFVLYQKGKINFDIFKKSALLFTIFNLVLIWQGYYSFIPQSKIIDYPDTVKFIKNQPDSEQYRFFRFYPPESYQQFEVFDVKDWTDYKLKTLESNIGVYFDMDTFGGVEPFLSARAADIFDEIGFERPTSISGKPWLISPVLSLDDKIQKFSSPRNLAILSMLNVKYVFSSFKLPNLNLIYQTTATEKNIPVYIYENPSALKRIYFAKNVKYVNPENALNELLKVKDFGKLTLIENPNDKIQMPNQISNSKSQIQIEEMRSEFVKIKTSGNGGWLIYSDANLPTWEATVDNQKTNIYTANYLFKSIYVPKGEHIVIFDYPGLLKQDIAAVKNIISGRR